MKAAILKELTAPSKEVLQEAPSIWAGQCAQSPPCSLSTSEKRGSQEH